MNAQYIYLAKKNKIQLSKSKGVSCAATVATFCKNLETLGYTLSQKLFEALQNQSEQQVAEIYTNLLPDLKKLKGAHRRFRPMYPNFPAQVMDASECELYINAMLHYWSAWVLDVVGSVMKETPGSTFIPGPGITFFPDYADEERDPLLDKVKYQQIDLGTEEEFYGLFTVLAGANSSISETDMEILKWFTTQPGIMQYVPERVPFKEISASLSAWFNSEEFNTKHIKTATDVLRLLLIRSI